MISKPSLAKPLIALSLLAGVLAQATATHMEYVGTIYPLRWGVSNTSDTVTPYKRMDKPVCYQKSSTVGITDLTDPGDPTTIGWEIIKATLVSKVTGTVYWTFNGPTALMPMGTTYMFTGKTMPAFIDICELQVVAIEAIEPDGGGGGTMDSVTSSPMGFLYGIPTFRIKTLSSAPPPPSGPPGGGGTTPPPPTTSTSIYVVLDAPKAPMSPAWCNVLDWACAAAQGESAETAATDKLTQKLWLGFIYDPSQEWWTRSSTDSGETFYPGAFMGAGKGQCNDFADFLVCASAGVSAKDLSAQRSNTYAIGDVYGFQTNSCQKAGSASVGPEEFAYHQFSNAGSIWDGAIKLGGTSYVLGMSTSAYKTAVLNHWFLWSDHSTVSDKWSYGTTFKPTLSAGSPP